MVGHRMVGRKKVVHVSIEGYFPELRGATCRQRARGEGSAVRTATVNALRNLLRQPGLKRKRFTTITLRVSIGQRIENVEV